MCLDKFCRLLAEIFFFAFFAIPFFFIHQKQIFLVALEKLHLELCAACTAFYLICIDVFGHFLSIVRTSVYVLVLNLFEFGAMDTPIRSVMCNRFPEIIYNDIIVICTEANKMSAPCKHVH